MSGEYEVRTADNLAVRVLAADDIEALETAAALLGDDDAEGSVYPVDAPVGADGDDPEADSPLDVGDHQ